MFYKFAVKSVWKKRIETRLCLYTGNLVKYVRSYNEAVKELVKYTKEKNVNKVSIKYYICFYFYGSEYPFHVHLRPHWFTILFVLFTFSTHASKLIKHINCKQYTRLIQNTFKVAETIFQPPLRETVCFASYFQYQKNEETVQYWLEIRRCKFIGRTLLSRIREYSPPRVFSLVWRKANEVN